MVRKDRLFEATFLEAAIVVPVATLGGLLLLTASVISAPVWGPILWLSARRRRAAARYTTAYLEAIERAHDERSQAMRERP
jgi:hypothetical protein